MASPPTNMPPYGGPPPRPNWWSRNWKWFVPAGCLTVVVLFAAFVGGIVMLVFGSMKQADVYKEALARAQSDPAVAQKLGSPIEPGMFLSGNINVNGPSQIGDSHPWSEGQRNDLCGSDQKCGQMELRAHASSSRWRRHAHRSPAGFTGTMRRMGARKRPLRSGLFLQSASARRAETVVLPVDQEPRSESSPFG